MCVTFDPAKNAKNIAERGLPFERVAELAWEAAVLQEDRRKDYGETRVRVLARWGQQLHVTVITMRGNAVHVISFRKANRKEVEWYEQEKG
jgi:uncharacterized DUF497 family protein